jgi:hypothetical protein
MIPQNGSPPFTFSSPRSENALEYGLGAASQWWLALKVVNDLMVYKSAWWLDIVMIFTL